MSGLVRLGKSGIEYLTHVWNFYSGCHHWKTGVCAVGEHCWAKALVNRHKNHYPNGFEPTFYPEALLSPLHLKEPSRIGVCFMGDLFGEWVDPNASYFHHTEISLNISLKEHVYFIINQCPQHRFLFLTKNPAGLIPWSPFPDKCWVGATATDTRQALEACLKLGDVECSLRYLSLEPMLNSINIPPEHLKVCKIGWLIIGALTGSKADLLRVQKQYQALTLMPFGNKYSLQPPIEWVEKIMEAADKAGIPVFLKNNLKPLVSAYNKEVCEGCEAGDPCHACGAIVKLRQELPHA